MESITTSNFFHKHICYDCEVSLDVGVQVLDDKLIYVYCMDCFLSNRYRIDVLYVMKKNSRLIKNKLKS